MYCHTASGPRYNTAARSEPYGRHQGMNRMTAQLLQLVPDPRRDEDRPARSLRVALVNMPFALAGRPSIQCGILKAVLERDGHSVDVFYLNLELAAILGAKTYREIAGVRTDQLLGEWLFGVAAFDRRSDESAYRAACPSIEETCAALGWEFDELCRLRNEVLPAQIDQWHATIDWSSYAAVGFTSTFEQNVAALALARRIKERTPEVVTIFGGANFDGEMGPEYLRAIPWIDYAVVGEGDVALPALVKRLGQGEVGAGIPGAVGRSDGAAADNGPGTSVDNLDRLPDPNYDEYFATLFRLGADRVLDNDLPRLLFESARGCWWGQKHHCTFCGLNNNTMAFRAKSPQRVLDELARLSDRYKLISLEAVDNIMDMRYLDEVCRPLAEEHHDYQIFYEVKANLTREQLRTMRRAGVVSIQPGIESLSSHVLQLMR